MVVSEDGRVGVPSAQVGAIDPHTHIRTHTRYDDLFYSPRLKKNEKKAVLRWELSFFFTTSPVIAAAAQTHAHTLTHKRTTALKHSASGAAGPCRMR